MPRTAGGCSRTAFQHHTSGELIYLTLNPFAVKNPLLLLVLLTCTVAHGADADFSEPTPATNRDSLLADSLYGEAISLFTNRRLEEGLEILDTVLTLARSSGQYEMLVMAENDRVRALEFLGMNALEVLKGYDAIDREIHPLMPEATVAHAKTWYNLGMWYHGVARYHLARDYLRRAVSVMEEAGRADFQRAMIYNVLGMTHDGLGDHTLAINYFRESIAVRESMFGKHAQQTKAVRINLITTLIASGNMEEAERELEILEEVLFKGGIKPRDSKLYMECKSEFLSASGKYSEAFEAFEQFEMLSTKVDMVEDMKVKMVVDRSALLTHLGRWEEADSALKDKLEAVGGDDVKVFLYKGLADLHIKWGRPAAALKYAGIAESYYFPAGRRAVRTPSDLISGVKHSLSALATTAKALDLYADSTDEPADRRAVLEMIDEAERVFSMAKRRADAGELINLREQGWFDIYEKGMKNAHALHKATGEAQWVERAWKISEDAKSATLLTSVNRLGPEISKLKPGREVEDELRLRNDLAYYAEEMKEGRLDPDERKVFLRKRLALDSLMETYQNRYPDYSAMRFDPVTPSLNEALEQARSGRSVLAYLCGEASVYGISVTKSGSRFEVLGRTDSLADAVSRYRSSLNTRPGPDDFDRKTYELNRAGRALYEMLVSPLLDLSDVGDRLLVIPDGPLHFLPFETLSTGSASNSSVAADYLIFDVDLSYAHSFTAFVKSTSSGQHFSGDFLGLAPEFHAAGPWRSLAGARSEIESIAARFPAGIAVNDTANYELFMSLKGQYRVLHFATHAFADEADPLNSALLLDGGTAAGRSGVLRASDLYAMSIPAEMVVLSACNTGAGPVRRGEGVMSLAHGFAYAGSPSVVMTLWPADDVAVKDLIEGFYSGLAEGKSKSASISAAKRAYLNTADSYTAHPYFWAGLISIGNDDPLSMEREAKIPMVVWIAAGLLLAGGVWLRRRKSAARKLT